ncbi:MAG: extracellular solute-binding protein, partial [Clostridiales bacterium]|nr:extracellular solute-binding protein [Clostridiales bacterium]
YAVDMRLYATEDETATYLLYPFIMATGGKMLSDDGKTAKGYLNSDQSVKGFQFLKDLESAGYTSYGIDKDGFFTGKHAMYLSSGWTIPDIKNKYSQTFPTEDSWGILPYPKDVAAVSPTASWSFGMANIDRGDKESVVKLLEWMVTPASSAAITTATGMIPARTSVVTDNPYAAGSAEKVLYDQLVTTGKKRPDTAAYSTFSSAFANVIIGLKNNNNVQSVVKSQTDALQADLDLFFS